MNKIKKRALAKKLTKVQNSMWDGSTDLMAGVFGTSAFSTSPLSQPFQSSMDAQYTPVTLNRVFLSYAYMTFGILQTMIDQPVEDGLRGGLEIDCDELSSEDVEKLNKYLNSCNVLYEVKNALRWAKLFGGAGLIINTAQDPETELDVEAINEGTPLSFFAADRWELLLNFLQDEKIPCPYNYYGQRLHKTRVIKIIGKEAPSYIKKRLQGWGMSEVERVVRDLNSYNKNQDLIYELLDEAKIDVWKIEGFNTNILSSMAQSSVNQRLQIATMLKNYHNAIVMDKEDEYDQKQLTFGGLAEMLQQIRIGAAASVRMPMTKLFGLSATGFNAGEDDIENYNALIESEVRAKAREVLEIVLPLCCQQLFGFTPESLTFGFKTLRVLSAEQEEIVKTSKYNRLKGMYQDGVFSGAEYVESLKKEGLLEIEVEAEKSGELTPPVNPNMTGEMPGVEGGSDPKDGKEGKDGK